MTKGQNVKNFYEKESYSTNFNEIKVYFLILIPKERNKKSYKNIWSF